jgi:type I restriction enzyme S subunit
MRTVLLAEVLEESRSGFWGSEAGAGAADVRVIRNGDIQQDGVRWDSLPLRGVSETEAARAAIRKNDILITTSGNCGYSAHVAEPPREPTIASNFVRILRFSRDTVVPRYIFRLIDSDHFRSRLTPYIRGTTLQNLSLPTAAERIDIPLPSVPAQRRISEILDKADALRAKRRAALAQLDILTRSIFLDMFGDPATTPMGWPTSQLQEVVKPGTVVTYGIVQAGDEFPLGVPYVRTGDIVNGEIVTEGLRHTDPALAAKFARSRVQTGEIVMSIRATVGTTALVPSELDGANLTQGTARIAPGDRVEGLYLLHLLRASGTQHWISLQIKGATFREITLTRLRELPVMVPPADLQRQFAGRVETVESLKSLQRDSVSKLNALFASLQHRAFRGEL